MRRRLLAAGSYTESQFHSKPNMFIFIAHIAAEFGRLGILRYILDKNASLLEEFDIFGYTVLHRAVQFGDVAVVKFLVEERGADIYQTTLHLPGNTVGAANPRKRASDLRVTIVGVVDNSRYF